MRRGWKGITISRDTIHIEGVKLGFENPVFFERHAVGGEYGAGWKSVGAGRLVTTFFGDDGSPPVLCDDRILKDENNVVVTYHNPLDNVEEMAHHYFKRCLEGHVVPYVVTKKTVFKWQEGFWTIMKKVFDENYKEAYIASGLIPSGELQHLISDAATMQIIRYVYVHMHICIYVYMYICTCIHMYVCDLHISINMYTCIYILIIVICKLSDGLKVDSVWRRTIMMEIC
jgi:isocitrate dehydrogenase